MADTHDAYEAGRSGAVFTGSSYLELQAYNRGRDAAAGATSMPVGGALILIQVYALAAACFWPVAGALGLGTFVFLRNHFAHAQPPYSVLVSVPLLICASVVALYVGYRIEERLSFVTLYRRLRVILRLVLMTMLITYFVISWRRPPQIPSSGVSVDWIFSQLSPFQLLLIIVGVVATHLLSKRSDEKFEVWCVATKLARQQGMTDEQAVSQLAENVAKQRKDHRQEVKRRRIRCAVYVGAVAAAILAVTGVPLGGVVVGFIAFGGLGALLSRFIPQNLIGMRWLNRFLGV